VARRPVGDVEICQCLQFPPEISLALESDPREIGKLDETVHHFDTVGKTAERLKEVRIRLVSAKPKARSDIHW